MDVPRYLSRIGYAGSCEPTARTLAALHWAHVRAIPFENLDILLGRPIRIDLASLEQKLVADRRGGYCFEHNTLFAAVLRDLGFRVTTLAARVRWGAAPDRVTARTHMLLRVDLAEGPMIADVGFGGQVAPVPLRLLPGLEQPTPLDTYRIVESAGAFTLESRVGAEWQPLYAFTLEEHHPIDYVVANHYTSTYPESHFTQAPFVARPDEGVRYSLRAGDHAVRRGDQVERRTVEDADELLTILARDFGLHFPPGTRFSSRWTIAAR